MYTLFIISIPFFHTHPYCTFTLHYTRYISFPLLFNNVLLPYTVHLVHTMYSYSIAQVYPLTFSPVIINNNLIHLPVVFQCFFYSCCKDCHYCIYTCPLRVTEPTHPTPLTQKCKVLLRTFSEKRLVSLRLISEDA